MIDGLILVAVQQVERTFGIAGTDQGVFPWQVQAFLPVYRNESTLRRDMNRLADCGLLRRVGGQLSRQGYRCQLKRVDRLPKITIDWPGEVVEKGL